MLCCRSRITRRPFNGGPGRHPPPITWGPGCRSPRWATPAWVMGGYHPPGTAPVNADKHTRSVGGKAGGLFVVGCPPRVCFLGRAGLRSRRGQHYCCGFRREPSTIRAHSAFAGFAIRLTWRVHGTLCRRNAGHPSRVPRQVAARGLPERPYQKSLPTRSAPRGQ